MKQFTSYMSLIKEMLAQIETEQKKKLDEEKNKKEKVKTIEKELTEEEKLERSSFQILKQRSIIGQSDKAISSPCIKKSK